MGRDDQLLKELLDLRVTSGFRKRTIIRRLGLLAGMAVLIWLLPLTPPRNLSDAGAADEKNGHQVERSIPPEVKIQLLRNDRIG